MKRTAPTSDPISSSTPHLRKYIFDGVEIGPEDEEYDRVVTIAELFLNNLEHIAVVSESFGHQNRPYLERFVRSAVGTDPQTPMAENPAASSDFLVARLRVEGRSSPDPA